MRDQTQAQLDYVQQVLGVKWMPSAAQEAVTPAVEKKGPLFWIDVDSTRETNSLLSNIAKAVGEESVETLAENNFSFDFFAGPHTGPWIFFGESFLVKLQERFPEIKFGEVVRQDQLKFLVTHSLQKLMDPQLAGAAKKETWSHLKSAFR